MRKRTVLTIATLLASFVGLTGAQALGHHLAPARGGTSPIAYGYVQTQVFTAPGKGSIAVGMPNKNLVQIQLRPVGSSTWGKPRVLFDGKGRLTCGAIDGAASPGGIALTLECDRDYYPDQAPVHSQAVVSRNLTTFFRHELPGEAYQPPAISPDGVTAAWPAGGGDGFVRWRGKVGFSRLLTTTFKGDGGAETIVADDAGTVTVMGAEFSRSGQCRFGVHAKPLRGSEQVQVITGVDPGCTEGSLTTVDPLTVRGDDGSRATTYVVSRPDTSSPWRLTTPRPVDGAGLVTYDGPPRKVIYQQDLDVVGKPLMVIGSPDRRRLMTQTYDPTTHAWSARRTVYDHGFAGCTGGDPSGEVTARVFLVELHCYAKKRADGVYPPHDGDFNASPRARTLLVSVDGVSWTAAPIARRPYGVSGGSTLLAAPGPYASRIVSASGITRVPVTTGGRCDFVFPVSPTRLLRLHGGPKAAWPQRVQLSTAHGWRTVSTIRMPRKGRCQRVFDTQYLRPTLFTLVGRGTDVALTVRKGGPHGWRVVRTPNRY